MAKIVDDNGFWLIKNNPMTKAGVYPYLGRQISPELEPDKIYYVLRPEEEIDNPETVESFNAVPFIDNHEMLGEGFTKYDKRPAGGVVFNVKSTNGIMTGDFKIFSEQLKDEIANGKKELSLGYLCNYEPETGVYKGQAYDYVQRNLRGNHIALVERGRMGADVRVYDKAITMDEMPVDIDDDIPAGAGSPNESGANGSLNNGEKEMVDKATMDDDKRQAIREVMAIASKPDSDFAGGEEEKIETIAKLLEKSEYSKSEAGTANDVEPDDKPTETVPAEEKPEETPAEEKPAEDACGKDADPDDDKKDDEVKPDDLPVAEPKPEDKPAEDELPRQIMKMIAKRDALVKELEPIIGTFACDEMTDKEVAEYACKKLSLQASQDEALPCLRGYLAGSKKATITKVYGLDSAISADNGIDPATQKYLKGE